MDRQLVQPRKPYQPDTIKPVQLGGTGAVTIEDAVINLGGISKNILAQANGIAPLDRNNKIPSIHFPPIFTATTPSLVGPTQLYTNHSYDFLINNYDILETYTLFVDHGSVSRNNDIITYNTPAQTGLSFISLNDKQYTFNIIDPYLAVPQITFPANNGTNITVNPTLLATPFTPMGTTDTHLNTSWQIATDVGFTNIVFESLNDTDTNHFDHITSTALTISTLYYARVKYTGVVLGETAWSNVVSFTTTATVYAIPTNEEAILASAGSSYLGWSVSIDDSMTRVVAAASERVYVFAKANDIWSQEATFINTDVGSASPWGFASYACISGDGNRMAVVDPQNNGGKAHIFLRTGTTWALEATVTGDDVLSDDGFGSWSLAFNQVGDTLIVGCNVQNVNQGAAYIFKRTGVSWAQEAKLVDAAGQSDDLFGEIVSMDAAGTRVVATAKHKEHTGLAAAGVAFVFVKSGTNWIQETMLVAPDAAANDQFGQCAQLSGDGTRIIVAAPDASPEFTGKCYVYLRTGTTWAYEATLMNDDYLTVDPNQNGGFGAYQIGFNYTGDVVAIGAPYINVGAVLNTGAVYVFQRSGTVWTQEAKLTASDQVDGACYGENVTMSPDGTKIVVGAGKAISNSYGGAVYIYN
jgi:hypothetical protein